MLSRFAILGAALFALHAVTVSAQTVTFTNTTYPNNNLWSENGASNGHLRVDLNADGREDFVSQNDASFNSGCTGSFAVTLSTGDGAYAAPVCYTIPSGIAILFATGDFYGSGRMDIAVVNDEGTAIYLYQNDGKGGLSLQGTVDTDGGISGIVAADVNHDNHVDLVIMAGGSGGTNNLSTLLGSGTGTFNVTSSTVFNVDNITGGALTYGDFDNDSNTDIFVTGASQVGGIILWGNGDGSFSVGPAVGGNTTMYAPYDFGSDGTMDLIGAPFQASANGTPTYYNYLDIERGHSNRIFTSQHVPLQSCTASGAPPVMADFNGDGINDIVVAEASDCQGDPPYTLNVLLGNSDGTFQPEQEIYSGSDWISEWHVMRASHSSKPDLTFFQAALEDGNEIANPGQVVMVNTTSGNFPACTPIDFQDTGVNVCSPTSSVGNTSPVTFSFGAANTAMGRDMEIWVDGKKLDESLKNTYSYYSFISDTIPLTNGPHSVSIFGVGWDYSLKPSGFTLDIGGNTCPIPDSETLNTCSPFYGSTLSSPVLVSASSNATGSDSIARMEVWVDGVKEFSTFNSKTLQTYLTLSPGWHEFDYYAVTANGAKFEDILFAAVQ